MAFVNLTKAINTINQDLLWSILSKCGCPPTFVATLQQFHNGTCAQVVMAGSQSSILPAYVGEKQWCVLAPIIYKLSLVAITLVSHHDLQSSKSVGVEHSLDGGFFNLQHLHSKTKTSCVVIFALQYANDIAFPSLTTYRLQHSIDVIPETYLHANLIVNTIKREVLSASSHDAPTFSIRGNQLKN